MNTPRTTPDQLIRWLEDGPRSAPADLLATVLSDLPRTQRNSLAVRLADGSARWGRPRASTAGGVLIAAALLAVIMLGLNLLVGSEQVHPPVLIPSAPPLPVNERLEAGSYVVRTADIPPFAITVPGGWQSFGTFAIYKGELGAPDMLGLGFWTVQNIYDDPCAQLLYDPPVGPAVDDLAGSLADAPWATATRPVPVRLDGRAGRFVDLTLSDDLGCSPDTYFLWRDPAGRLRYPQGAGQRFRIWVLDVDGHRTLIEADWLPGASQADIGELADLVQSIRFESSSTSPGPTGR